MSASMELASIVLHFVSGGMPFFSLASVLGVLATVVLPVAAVWTVGLFLVILMIVAKAGSRRLAQLDKPQWSDAGQLE